MSLGEGTDYLITVSDRPRPSRDAAQERGDHRIDPFAQANDILALRQWMVEEEAGELCRSTLDEPAESPSIKLA